MLGLISERTAAMKAEALAASRAQLWAPVGVAVIFTLAEATLMHRLTPKETVQIKMPPVNGYRVRIRLTPNDDLETAGCLLLSADPAKSRLPEGLILTIASCLEYGGKTYAIKPDSEWLSFTYRF